MAKWGQTRRERRSLSLFEVRSPLRPAGSDRYSTSASNTQPQFNLSWPLLSLSPSSGGMLLMGVNIPPAPRALKLCGAALTQADTAD